MMPATVNEETSIHSSFIGMQKKYAIIFVIKTMQVQIKLSKNEMLLLLNQQ